MSKLLQAICLRSIHLKLLSCFFVFFFSNLFKVIKSLDPRHNTDSTSEIYSLKSQVHEKDSYISYLEVSAIDEFDSMPVFFKKKAGLYFNVRIFAVSQTFCFLF